MFLGVVLGRGKQAFLVLLQKSGAVVGLLGVEI